MNKWVKWTNTSGLPPWGVLWPGNKTQFVGRKHVNSGFNLSAQTLAPPATNLWGSGRGKPREPWLLSARNCGCAQPGAGRGQPQSRREDAGGRARAARPGLVWARRPWRTSRASQIFMAAAWPCSAAATPLPAWSSASAALGSPCARSPLSPAPCG